jgi:hypothetical protein
MLRIAIGFILWLVLAVSATDGFAQCINGDPFASVTADNSINTAVTISTCNFQTEYGTIDGILAGNTYQLGYDLGGCITISTSPLGPEVAWGTSPLTWVASTSGTIYVHLARQQPVAPVRSLAHLVQHLPVQIALIPLL